MSKLSNLLIFDKEYQKHLKDKYKECIIKYWNNDEKMIKYEMNKIAYLIPICNGKYIICLDKVKLEKNFYFGYSDVGQGLSYEANNKRINDFRENAEENFKAENLSSIDSMIETLEEIIGGNSMKTALHYPQYFVKEDEDFIIHDLGFDDPWRGRTFTGKGYDLNKDDLKKILLGYNYLKKYTEKKIDSYLKRYGSSKIQVVSYWVDE